MQYLYQTFYKFDNISEYQSVIESSAMFHNPSFFNIVQSIQFIYTSLEPTMNI